jgi:hypothetical protein
MKQALISPNETIQYISSWVGVSPNYTPVYTSIGQRVAEVSDAAFEVAPPLFWADCADEVTAEAYCYADGCIEIPPDAPRPQTAQPVTEGAQTL